MKMIGGNVKYGFSIILCDKINVSKKARIGHFNLIKIKNLCVKEGARIDHFNYIAGNISVIMNEFASIHNMNKISNKEKVSVIPQLLLYKNARIGVRHMIDVSDDITIGKNSMLAGCDTQLWTHSYIFTENDDKVYKITSPISIGENVYVGARCTILSGVSIGNASTIGAHTCVSKSIENNKMVVGGSNRIFDYKRNDVIESLKLEYGDVQTFRKELKK